MRGWGSVTPWQRFLLVFTPLAVWHILFYPIDDKVATTINIQLSNNSKKNEDVVPNEHTEPLVFQEGQIRGAAMMLVSKPWTNRRGDRQCYFNKSMDDLARNWFPTNPYPIILQHPKGWTATEIKDIRQRWPQLQIYFSQPSFRKLKPPKLMQDDEKPLSSLGYKKMCAFKTYGIKEAPYIRTRQLDYLFYIDDDACVTEPIQYDVFATMQQHKIAYTYKQIFTDPENVVHGLPDFVQEYKRQHNNLQPANPTLEAFVLDHQKDGSQWAFSTNLEWLDVQEFFFRRPDIVEFYRVLQESGMIFHRRWGDAPLRFVMAYLFFHNSQVMRLCSEYVHSGWPTAVSTCTDPQQQTPTIQDAVLQQLKDCVATCN
ncbi:K10967 alpha 1,2-mannosyltransferase [Seminavis robusta]|uniref:K10967 alpha 1,2-mannosyltransferase n=1 Tax=Seminavis robusta TaxID=568900 RepID=A0A9N8HCZ8_9STRA|nr:K10967 alpha 1,2-mannosyltransferase [Seminavis robusta]|eukprot:Sro436_g142500.1 K10967 alpha 1,2-mannosyltransferase EC 2.4.1 (371) ;mRNA; r:4006-5118